jgi:hypothetical protein
MCGDVLATGPEPRFPWAGAPDDFSPQAVILRRHDEGSRVFSRQHRILRRLRMTCDSRGPLPGTPPMGVCVGRAKFKWSCVTRRRCCLVAVVLGSWSGILAGGFPTCHKPICIPHGRLPQPTISIRPCRHLALRHCRNVHCVAELPLWRTRSATVRLSAAPSLRIGSGAR